MSANKPASLGAPYTVPPEPNRLPAIGLALAVHAALLAFLWVGISWQKEQPAVEAEIWDMKVESAAAPALPPPPEPEVRQPEPAPAPEPEPLPEPKVLPPPPIPKVAEPEPVKPATPDINIEREKKKLAEQKKREQLEAKERKEREERELAEKQEREELKRKEIADKKAAEKKEQAKDLAKKEREKKLEAEKKLADEKKLEAQKKQEAEKKLAAEKADADKKKLAAEKAEKAAKAKAEAAAEQAKLDKLRDAELKRITGAAGTVGNGEKSTAPKADAGYVAKLTALIKSNTRFAGSTDVPGNPKASFKVELLPTGEIMSVRLIKSSGVSAFDDAVERGINNSSPLPKKKDGTVERTLQVNFSMKDLN